MSKTLIVIAILITAFLIYLVWSSSNTAATKRDAVLDLSYPPENREVKIPNLPKLPPGFQLKTLSSLDYQKTERMLTREEDFNLKSINVLGIRPYVYIGGEKNIGQLVSEVRIYPSTEIQDLKSTFADSEVWLSEDKYTDFASPEQRDNFKRTVLKIDFNNSGIENDVFYYRFTRSKYETEFDNSTRYVTFISRNISVKLSNYNGNGFEILTIQPPEGGNEIVEGKSYRIKSVANNKYLSISKPLENYSSDGVTYNDINFSEEEPSIFKVVKSEDGTGFYLVEEADNSKNYLYVNKCYKETEPCKINEGRRPGYVNIPNNVNKDYVSIFKQNISLNRYSSTLNDDEIRLPENKFYYFINNTIVISKDEKKTYSLGADNCSSSNTPKLFRTSNLLPIKYKLYPSDEGKNCLEQSRIFCVFTFHDVTDVLSGQSGVIRQIDNKGNTLTMNNSLSVSTSKGVLSMKIAKTSISGTSVKTGDVYYTLNGVNTTSLADSEIFKSEEGKIIKSISIDDQGQIIKSFFNLSELEASKYSLGPVHRYMYENTGDQVPRITISLDSTGSNINVFQNGIQIHPRLPAIQKLSNNNETKVTPFNILHFNNEIKNGNNVMKFEIDKLSDKPYKLKLNNGLVSDYNQPTFLYLTNNGTVNACNYSTTQYGVSGGVGKYEAIVDENNMWVHKYGMTSYERVFNRFARSFTKEIKYNLTIDVNSGNPVDINFSLRNLNNTFSIELGYNNELICRNTSIPYSAPLWSVSLSGSRVLSYNNGALYYGSTRIGTAIGTFLTLDDNGNLYSKESDTSLNQQMVIGPNGSTSATTSTSTGPVTSSQISSTTTPTNTNPPKIVDFLLVGEKLLVGDKLVDNFSSPKVSLLLESNRLVLKNYDGTETIVYKNTDSTRQLLQLEVKDRQGLILSNNISTSPVWKTSYPGGCLTTDSICGIKCNVVEVNGKAVIRINDYQVFPTRNKDRLESDSKDLNTDYNTFYFGDRLYPLATSSGNVYVTVSDNGLIYNISNTQTSAVIDTDIVSLKLSNDGTLIGNKINGVRVFKARDFLPRNAGSNYEVTVDDKALWLRKSESNIYSVVFDNIGNTTLTQTNQKMLPILPTDLIGFKLKASNPMTMTGAELRINKNGSLVCVKSDGSNWIVGESYSTYDRTLKQEYDGRITYGNNLIGFGIGNVLELSMFGDLLSVNNTDKIILKSFNTTKTNFSSSSSTSKFTIDNTLSNDQNFGDLIVGLDGKIYLGNTAIWSGAYIGKHILRLSPNGILEVYKGNDKVGVVGSDLGFAGLTQCSLKLENNALNVYDNSGLLKGQIYPLPTAQASVSTTTAPTAQASVSTTTAPTTTTTTAPIQQTIILPDITKLDSTTYSLSLNQKLVNLLDPTTYMILTSSGLKIYKGSVLKYEIPVLSSDKLLFNIDGTLFIQDVSGSKLWSLDSPCFNDNGTYNCNTLPVCTLNNDGILFVNEVQVYPPQSTTSLSTNGKNLMFRDDNIVNNSDKLSFVNKKLTLSNASSSRELNNVDCTILKLKNDGTVILKPDNLSNSLQGPYGVKGQVGNYNLSLDLYGVWTNKLENDKVYERVFNGLYGKIGNTSYSGDLDLSTPKTFNFGDNITVDSTSTNPYTIEYNKGGRVICRSSIPYGDIKWDLGLTNVYSGTLSSMTNGEVKLDNYSLGYGIGNLISLNNEGDLISIKKYTDGSGRIDKIRLCGNTVKTYIKSLPSNNFDLVNTLSNKDNYNGLIVGLSGDKAFVKLGSNTIREFPGQTSPPILKLNSNGMLEVFSSDKLNPVRLGSIGFDIDGGYPDIGSGQDVNLTVEVDKLFVNYTNTTGSVINKQIYPSNLFDPYSSTYLNNYIKLKTTCGLVDYYIKVSDTPISYPDIDAGLCNTCDFEVTLTTNSANATLFKNDQLTSGNPVFKCQTVSFSSGSKVSYYQRFLQVESNRVYVRGYKDGLTMTSSASYTENQTLTCPFVDRVDRLFPVNKGFNLMSSSTLSTTYTYVDCSKNPPVLTTSGTSYSTEFLFESATSTSTSPLQVVITSTVYNPLSQKVITELINGNTLDSTKVLKSPSGNYLLGLSSTGSGMLTLYTVTNNTVSTSATLSSGVGNKLEFSNGYFTFTDGSNVTWKVNGYPENRNINPPVFKLTVTDDGLVKIGSLQVYPPQSSLTNVSKNGVGNYDVVKEALDGSGVELRFNDSGADIVDPRISGGISNFVLPLISGLPERPILKDLGNGKIEVYLPNSNIATSYGKSLNMSDYNSYVMIIDKAGVWFNGLTTSFTVSFKRVLPSYIYKNTIKSGDSLVTNALIYNNTIDNTSITCEIDKRGTILYLGNDLIASYASMNTYYTNTLNIAPNGQVRFGESSFDMYCPNTNAEFSIGYNNNQYELYADKIRVYPKTTKTIQTLVSNSNNSFEDGVNTLANFTVLQQGAYSLKVGNGSVMFNDTVSLGGRDPASKPFLKLLSDGSLCVYEMTNGVPEVIKKYSLQTTTTPLGITSCSLKLEQSTIKVTVTSSSGTTDYVVYPEVTNQTTTVGGWLDYNSLYYIKYKETSTSPYIYLERPNIAGSVSYGPEGIYGYYSDGKAMYKVLTYNSSVMNKFVNAFFIRKFSGSSIVSENYNYLVKYNGEDTNGYYGQVLRSKRPSNTVVDELNTFIHDSSSTTIESGLNFIKTIYPNVVCISLVNSDDDCFLDASGKNPDPKISYGGLSVVSDSEFKYLINNAKTQADFDDLRSFYPTRFFEFEKVIV